MDGKIAKGTTDRRERVRPGHLSVGAAEPQVGLVSTSEENVTLLDIFGDLLRLTKQV